MTTTHPDTNTPKPTDLCLCGHIRQAHDHHRPGTDCGACGKTICPEFWFAIADPKLPRCWKARHHLRRAIRWLIAPPKHWA